MFANYIDHSYMAIQNTNIDQEEDKILIRYLKSKILGIKDYLACLTLRTLNKGDYHGDNGDSIECIRKRFP